MVYLAWPAKCALVPAARLIVDNFDDNLLKIKQKSKMFSPFFKLNFTFEIDWFRVRWTGWSWSLSKTCCTVSTIYVEIRFSFVLWSWWRIRWCWPRTFKKSTSGLFYRFIYGFRSAYLYIEYAYCDDNDVEYVCLPLQNQQNWQQCRKDRHPVTKNFVDAMIASLCVYRELATALFSIFLVEALQRYPVKAWNSNNHSIIFINMSENYPWK